MNEVIKDSGSMREFETGAHRDNAVGKGRCDLLPLKQVAEVMGDPVITEIALFMETKDKFHLRKAIRESAKTIPQFKIGLPHMMLEASKLYLKIEPDNEDKVDTKILPILSKYPGDTNVLLYYAKDKVTKKASSKFNVKVSEKFLKELRNILGEENVKCVFWCNRNFWWRAYERRLYSKRNFIAKKVSL